MIMRRNRFQVEQPWVQQKPSFLCLTLYETAPNLQFAFYTLNSHNLNHYIYLSQPTSKYEFCSQFWFIIMLQPTEQSLVKIDAVISGIRMINLHVYNYLIDHPNPKQSRENRIDRVREQNNHELKKLNAAHMQEHLRFISDYIKKCLHDMEKVKFVLPPLTFRNLRHRLHEDDFLRYENNNYGVKFIFTDLFRDCLLNIEIYKKAGGGRISGLAMRKLECTFLYEMSLRYPEACLTFQTLEAEGKSILEEVTFLFGGEKCSVCYRHQAFNTQTMCFLPPTVREVVEGVKENKEGKRDRKYYHESCL